MTTFNELAEEYQPYYGTLVIDSLDKISELIEIVEEPDDYYYRLFSIEHGIYLSSCVGWIYPLKGRLPDREYQSLRNVFDLNDWRKSSLNSN
jgi:hypothetical protein